MLIGKELYFEYLVLIYLVFFLFVVLISIFGFIFLFLIKKINKNDWDLNFLETSFISFAIGLSIYISLSFVLDIFQFYNFYSAYFSVIIIDICFILYLIKRKVLTKKIVSTFIISIKKKLYNNPKEYFTLILIILIIIFLQIIVLWDVTTNDFALSSKDTYGWLGQMWHLLDRGYLWRERHPIHYPKGYVFFISAPVLIYPNYLFAFFYFKYGGIPIFSFYIIVFSTILKKIFKKNYLVLTGLMFILLSNILFSRFSVNTSSTIPTLMILFSVIIFRSKCPFYFTAFLIQLMFLFNAIFAFCYFVIWICFVLTKLLYNEINFRTLIINYIFKPITLLFALTISYLTHTLIILNISFVEFLNAYFANFGAQTINLSNISNSLALSQLLQTITFSDILKYTFPNNIFVNLIRDLEKKGFSFFIVFSIMGFFLSINEFFKKKFSDVIKYGKLSLLILIFFYVFEAFFYNSSNIFVQNLSWMKDRMLEGLIGPIIILSCFSIEFIIEKSKLLTIYVKNKSLKYNNLLKKNFLLKFLRIEYIVLSILLISTFSTYLIHRNIYYKTYFSKDHMETIFYIKDNIPDDSKILVNFYDGTGDALNSLLSTYRLYDWKFSEGENNISEIKQYIYDKNIKYILIDLETVNSTELDSFLLDPNFENLFENDVYILFEYDRNLVC